MDQSSQEKGYKIWAVDDVVYGPVDALTLMEWVKDERVLTDTWVFVMHEGKWAKAGQIPELRAVFHSVLPGGVAAAPAPLIAGIKPGALRRVKILGEMSDQQLGRFAQFMEVENARQFHTIVKQGDPGDAMYLILEGELRVRQMIGGKETVLVTLLAGEFFGDISLFDHGPRSADVVANNNSVLLKVSAANLQRMVQDAPELATPFLIAICKTLTARIRADNKRLRDSINVARASR
ncbi:MAG: cyclic nucleotide-binding domain-containing protein [Limisphaerales bacterium]